MVDVVNDRFNRLAQSAPCRGRTLQPPLVDVAHEEIGVLVEREIFVDVQEKPYAVISQSRLHGGPGQPGQRIVNAQGDEP